MAAVGGDEAHREFMRQALDLAERGWGRVQPNPLVGAVVVRAGEVVGVGWHAEHGGEHAEIAALRAAGAAAAGATLYVTLEPCAHTGKTPPCTDAIQRAGIARVVYATEDPHAVAGGGARCLAEQGIDVLGGVERDAARTLNAPFFHAVEQESCFVALKLAVSLDAAIAPAPGARAQLTGSEAVADAHRWRAAADAIVVGAGTARVDDPLLTVRGDIAPRVVPVRVVLDSKLTLSPGSRLARTARDAPLWLFASSQAPRDRERCLESLGARVTRVAVRDGMLDPLDVLGALWDDGLRSVLCEGGARLAGSLLRERRVQRLILYVAPVLFGAGAVPAFAGAAPEPADDWLPPTVLQLGPDVRFVLDRRSSA
ncbi:MAG: bifunctional diaminohydroxyphosphoribosylaminopyrimidine deaminase/5-amino-6-(5-phosphoribosylamino)uracil reductase RibD [Longimicrobiales bacterium]